ncbi:hypothetical protein [Rhizobium leguminosarum]|jgi:hypothetical protein|uniref:hypothetical protein n=1 Tax=Rhizobium leguminosarum TaxID=384 RepID=UPI002E146A59|nr:hypothetical protein U8Q02_42220 [Rhizobium leguminosarum]
MTNHLSAYWNGFQDLRRMRHMRIAIVWAVTSAVVLTYFVTRALLELVRTGTLSTTTVLASILLISGYHVAWTLIITAARFLIPQGRKV